MTDLDKALATQMTNVVKRTGKSLAEITAVVNLRRPVTDLVGGRPHPRGAVANDDHERP